MFNYQVELRVISGGGFADRVVFREVVLLVPPLFLAGLDLGDRDVLLPVVCPVQLALKQHRLEINN